ncbi:MAG: serine/threonine protein kinase, partial [Planctomycetales bacterium]
MNQDQSKRFLQMLERCKLLDAEQLKQAAPEANGASGPLDLAKRLVAKGLLTDWQAAQALTGRTDFSFGKFKLVDQVGFGCTGPVFHAEGSLGKRVALKVVAPDLIGDSATADRFHREVKSSASLSHPNVVEVHDVGCEGDAHYLVIECVDGLDLARWIEESQEIPTDWACECALQAARGLQHLMERGLAHGDVSPSNLLLTPNDWGGPESVKLLDAGLARVAVGSPDENLLTGQLLESLDCVSPEHAENAAADIRSDVFGLGCVLFRLLTKTVPFPDGSPLDRLRNRVRQDAPPPSKHRAGLSAALDQVVLKMLARKPEDRYQTPAEVAAALEPFTIDADSELEAEVPDDPDPIEKPAAAKSQQSKSQSAARTKQSKAQSAAQTKQSKARQSKS